MISLCVFLPQPCHRCLTVDCPVSSACVVEEVDPICSEGCRVWVVWCCDGKLDVGIKAVVEIGTFDDEVGEEVVRVPEEEVLELAGDGGGE